MSNFWNLLSSGGDLLLVVLGFSTIIILHEAGHFLAARWAGIRVLAFAVGFGPALFSYRKGLGFRRGSSEPDYNQLTKDAVGLAGERRESARNALSGKISPTEYRLNALPFGGYVKMLGQDDADPGATSNEPDSYQNCVPWKRMIVISAGVVFNIITAAVLFIIVFNPAVGLLTEPAKIGALVESDRPAATAVATNAAQLGVKEPGLKPGDTIVSINGETPAHFNDFALAVAMSRKGDPLNIDVQRPGVAAPLKFLINPEVDPGTGMLSIGAMPMASDRIVGGNARTIATVDKGLATIGFPDLHAGMRLVEVDGQPAHTPYDIDAAIDRSNGKPVNAIFEVSAGKGAVATRRTIQINPLPRLMTTKVEFDPKTKSSVPMSHLLGLTPVLAVEKVSDASPAQKAGIKDGDIFVQIGAVEWPSVPAGMAEIRANKDKDVTVAVLRKNTDGVWEEKTIGPVHADKEGRLGFTPTDSARRYNVVSTWPIQNAADVTPSGGRLPALTTGSRITAVNGTPIATLGELRNTLKQITAADPAAKITLSFELPSHSASHPSEQIAWPIPADEIASLQRLGWESPLDSGAFEPEKFVWKSQTILGAIPMGLHETHRVMMNTYLTFARLFQGSVKVEHLKGPVGIAHIGVAIADRGYIWLLFFMALISVNLAVINFLPMPIADGGHMVFLIYEQFTGRQPSVRFQNAAAIAGLVIIGTLFLVVTYNDVGHVFTALKNYFSS